MFNHPPPLPPFPAYLKNKGSQFHQIQQSLQAKQKMIKEFYKLEQELAVRLKNIKKLTKKLMHIEWDISDLFTQIKSILPTDYKHPHYPIKAFIGFWFDEDKRSIRFNDTFYVARTIKNLEQLINANFPQKEALILKLKKYFCMSDPNEIWEKEEDADYLSARLAQLKECLRENAVNELDSVWIIVKEMTHYYKNKLADASLTNVDFLQLIAYLQQVKRIDPALIAFVEKVKINILQEKFPPLWSQYTAHLEQERALYFSQKQKFRKLAHEIPALKKGVIELESEAQNLRSNMLTKFYLIPAPPVPPLFPMPKKMLAHKIPHLLERIKKIATTLSHALPKDPSYQRSLHSFINMCQHESHLQESSWVNKNIQELTNYFSEVEIEIDEDDRLLLLSSIMDLSKTYKEYDLLQNILRQQTQSNEKKIALKTF